MNLNLADWTLKKKVCGNEENWIEHRVELNACRDWKVEHDTILNRVGKKGEEASINSNRIRKIRLKMKLKCWKD